MSEILTQLKTLTKDLNQLNVEWALVGALAASIYSEPRTTRDIDVAILARTKEEQESIISNLMDRGYKNRQELMQLEPIWKLGIRLQAPSKKAPSIAVDFLFSSSGIEAEIVRDAISIEIFPEIFIPVASLSHILAMKILSQNDNDRIKDRLDVQILLSTANQSEIQTTKESLRLIQERGFSRGKDLMQEFEMDLKKYQA